MHLLIVELLMIKIKRKKLKKQLAHPSARRLKSFLKDEDIYDNEIENFIEELSATCDVFVHKENICTSSRLVTT